MLTGTIKSPADIPKEDLRHDLDRFKPENFSQNLKVSLLFKLPLQVRGNPLID
jgi:hypothetical protein